MSLTLIPPLKPCRPTPRYITPCIAASRGQLFPGNPGRPIAYDGFDGAVTPPQLPAAGRLGRLRRHDGRAALDLRLDAPPAWLPVPSAVAGRARPRLGDRLARLLHLPPPDGPDVRPHPRTRSRRRLTIGRRTLRRDGAGARSRPDRGVPAPCPRRPAAHRSIGPAPDAGPGPRDRHRHRHGASRGGGGAAHPGNSRPRLDPGGR